MRFAYMIDRKISYYRKVLKGVAQFAQAQPNIEMQIVNVPSPDGFHSLDQAGYDGIILGTFLENSKEASGLPIPAVSVSNTFPGLIPKVVTDDVAVGRIVARHLLDKGHRHFAFWGHGISVFAEQRWTGFAGTIIAARGKGSAPARTMKGERFFRRWLTQLPRPLALMTSGDDKGAQAIAACHALGWRVPEDVAVVGVDNDELYSELTSPPLSSVAQQTERIGYLAAECLVRLARGKKIPSLTLVPPGPLIARQSSRAIAPGDAVVAEAMLFLDQRLDGNVDIFKMSNELGLSRRSLEMRFKSALGRTPGQELSRLRIERAQSLLATTDLPLKKIAVLSGFGNQVQMTHVFRRSTGQTPMGYRRGFLLRG